MVETVKAAKRPARHGPRVSFIELQARNKRRSFILVVMMLGIVTAIGTTLGATWGCWWLGLLIGLVAAIIHYTAARMSGTRMVMAATGARPLGKREDPQLVNVIEEIAISAGMPCPAIWIIEEDSSNAFATGFDRDDAAVAITRGLRHKLKRDELQAVIAHEIGHIRNGDSGYMVLMAVLVGSVALLADIGIRTLRHGGRSRRGGAQAVGLIVLLVLVVLAPLFARLLRAAVSRQREFLADATAVELTRQPQALVSALQKLTADTTPLVAANRATNHLFIVNPMRRARAGGGALSTHPPLAARIKRIEDLYS